MGLNIATILGDGLGQLVKDVVGSFKLSPEKKAELQQVIDQNTHEIQMKEYELQVRAMDAESKAIEAASANIRAEAQSGDKWTSRARPTFLYLFYVILAFNFILVPISQMIKGMSLDMLHPIEFPDIMWEVFVAGYLGYTGVRSWEKSKLATN
jgi:hypothetical protein